MITATLFQVNQNEFQNLKSQIPEFDNRIDINCATGNFFYDRWVVLPEFKNTVWDDILKTLPFSIGEARLMKLNPGTAYYCHADVDDRYHLNITGERSFLVDLDSNVLHPVANDGCWYEMDAGTRHSAVNFGNDVRIQLVVRKLLERNKLLDPVSVKISLEKMRHDYRYVFDDVYSPKLNRLIKKGSIDNFSIKDEQVQFTIERDLLNELIEICPRDFKVTICQQS